MDFYSKLHDILLNLYLYDNVKIAESTIEELSNLKTKLIDKELQFICDLFLYLSYYKLAKLTNEYKDYKNADVLLKERIKKKRNFKK